jgi:uncharacterized membrane protein
MNREPENTAPAAETPEATETIGAASAGETETGLGMSVGRLEAFSDGVLAIVITLLILDISVPKDPTGSLASALADQWQQYVAYLLSFLIVGIIWLNHHATINLLARTNHTLQVLNLLLLLPVSVLPWPTALLAEYADGSADDQRVAVLVYGLFSSLMAITFNILWRYIMRHPELHKPGVTAKMLAVRNRRFNIGPFVYPIATLLGLLSAPLFLALMLALALLYLLPTPDVQV